MSDAVRCKSCGNPVEPEVAQAHDGACPWCLAAFTFSPEPIGNPVTASKDPSKQFGKYVRTEKLGAGGMGEVWKALDSELNRWVALKFLKDEDPSSTARFQREARTAAGLSHSGIAAIHEVGEVDGRHFIAMQYVAGRTMAHFPRQDRRLIVRLFRDAARALDHAHRHGIIHRDLKPDNLMVEEREDGWHVVILDFGLARSIEGGEKLSQSGEVYGTAPYMSPEQARGDHLDERADVYGLGATMYDVLTGKVPFEGSNLLDVIRRVGAEPPVKPRKLNPRLHRDLETIVLKCLEKDRERRYANARELAEDLERFLNSDPIVARPPSTLYRLKMTLGKRKAVVAAVFATAGLIATAAIVIPQWRSEAGARVSQEAAVRDKRERTERARPHLEAGRKILNRMRTRLREAHKPEDLKAMCAHARSEYGQALLLAPDSAEALLETGIASALAGEKEQALEAIDRAIAADADFTPAYLERVRMRIDDYEDLRHAKRGGVIAESPESKTLRDRLEADLARVERFSKDYPQQKYAQALLAFAQGDFAKAAEQLGQYLEREPEDGRAHYWRAHALFHLPRLTEAIEACDRALACNSRDGQAFLLRGAAKQDLKDLAGAIADYSRSIEVRKDPHGAYFNRGNAKNQSGDPQGAIADYDRAIELKKDFQDAYFNRGRAKHDLGDFPAAFADYAKALELDPKDAEVFTMRGVAYWDLRRLDEAIADHTKAIELNPNLALAWSNRGIARNAKGLRDEAIADHTKAIELKPDYPTAYSNRGVAKSDKGLVDEAIADYSKAIEIDPNHSAAFHNRGRAKSKKGLYDEAIADHTNAIRLAPKDVESFVCRAFAKSRKGLVDEAIADYTRAIELNPKHVLAHTNRGLAREARGLFDEAIADFTKAIELEPGDSDHYNDRGIARERRGLFDDAIADYDQAIKLDAKDPKAYTNRGSAKEAKGLFEEGAADYRKSLELAPPDWPPRKSIEARLAITPELRLFREGNRLHEAKKYKEAIAIFERIVQGYPKSREVVSSAYNIACAHALLGDKAKALEWLAKSVDLGWDNVEHLEGDADLESIRLEEGYKKLVEHLKSK